MKVYVDGSAVLRRVLHQPGMIQDWGHWDLAIASRLTWIEGHRSLDRLRVAGRLTVPDLAHRSLLLRTATERIREIQISAAILERAASPFPTSLGTLDAIHLATALAWMQETGERLTMLTHDRELAIAALTSGLDVWPKLRLG